jgi:hypothetical protein
MRGSATNKPISAVQDNQKRKRGQKRKKEKKKEKKGTDLFF